MLMCQKTEVCDVLGLIVSTNTGYKGVLKLLLHSKRLCEPQYLLLTRSQSSLTCVSVQSAEERVPVWYVMDEFGSQVQHSDQPSCGLAPFFHTPDQVTYSVLWPLRDLHEGGEHTHTFVKLSL